VREGVVENRERHSKVLKNRGYNLEYNVETKFLTGHCKEAYVKDIYDSESAGVFNARPDSAGGGGIYQKTRACLGGGRHFSRLRDFRSAAFRMKAGATS
jgi:hypothetical protein